MEGNNVAVKGVGNLQIAPEKMVREETEIVQLIVFSLGGEEFSAEINQVREIIRVGLITPIPDSPGFIKGVTNVRGEITVAIDLKALFFLPVNQEVENKHIVITEQEKNLFGLMVDEVTQVLRIPETEIKPPPEVVTRIDTKYVSGLVTRENRLIVLLDLTKVLSEEEFVRTNEIFRSHHVAEGMKGQGRHETVKKEEETLPERQVGAEDVESLTTEGGSRKRASSKKNKHR